MDAGIYLQNAKIATMGARAEDVFFIVDQAGMAIAEGPAQQQLREVLLSYLESA